MIRALTPDDVNQVRELHSLYFKNAFDFPRLLEYICAFIIEDENKRIVTAGGVRSIAECAIITDLSLSPRIRIKALYQMLEASSFVCRKSGYDQMHVWSRDDAYTRGLKRTGFRSHGGDSLILDL